MDTITSDTIVIETSDKLAERFWSKVDKRGDDECWEWKANKDRYGYGILSVHCRTNRAHRLAYALATDANVPAGMCVLHTCDNPRCCNPRHLFLGTHSENMADRNRKNRQAKGDAIHALRGVRHPLARLTDSAVEFIRKSRGSMLQKDLAKMFGVSRNLICMVQRGTCWKHTLPAES